MHRTPVPDEFRPDAAREPQIKFIRGLRDERDLSSLTEAQRKWLVADDFSKLRSGKASEIIEMMLLLPKKPRQSNFPDVPAGRYAVEHDGVLKFYSVDRPTEGKWAGFTFLNVWASDTTYPIKNIECKKEVLGLIAEDPYAAATAFGREFKHCAICGRGLTRRLSRELGIGPVCGARFYDEADWEDVKAEAREAIIARGEDPNETVEV